ncbi:HpcH/HpaI aldolase family protein [Melghirimyces algeriensis]|uniref:4-hydroxy-2-oxoheptanedioate aldolase n=1 Tax=Melghirimyces algeriensis TaxID=910412 RepID=A0A521F202_9BACL|nr:aldolase/citrate lyase family protein [Melghirimyces algeriensis]SMO90219.1 4-hydroxy-2-oxoheptanedioate aldolase [Melghirimyces algeriensis]
MRRNELKRKLDNGHTVWGLFCSIPSPVHVEIIACAGYDFVIIDTEHTLINPETLENMIRAAEARNITPLVRVPDTAFGSILRALDAGAQGVVVPHVNSGKDVEDVVRASRYFPEGMRSLNGGRVPGFGIINLEEYIHLANREVMVIPMIENRVGVENLDDILSVNGVDMVLEGAADLSQSFGIPWQTRHPMVREALQRIHDQTVQHDVPFCAIPRLEEDIQTWKERGVRAFVLGEERGLAFRAVRSHLETMKRSMEREGQA